MSVPRCRRGELAPDERARLTCHRLATTHVGTDDHLPDFDVFVVAVGIVADSLMREVDRESERTGSRARVVEVGGP